VGILAVVYESAPDKQSYIDITKNELFHGTLTYKLFRNISCFLTCCLLRCMWYCPLALTNDGTGKLLL